MAVTGPASTGATASDALCAPPCEADALLDSHWPLLRETLRQQPRPGDADLDQVIAIDRHGATRLVTTPPLARASMCPTPWDSRLLTRLWRLLNLPLLGRNGLVMRPLRGMLSPPARQRTAWRSAGRNRRLLLLALVLGQTAVASYFMAATLPFHGRHPLEPVIQTLYAILFA